MTNEKTQESLEGKELWDIFDIFRRVIVKKLSAGDGYRQNDGRWDEISVKERAIAIYKLLT